MRGIIILIILLLLCALCHSVEYSFSDKWIKIQIAKDFISKKITSYQTEIQTVTQNNQAVAQSIDDPNIVRKIIINNSNRLKEAEYALKNLNKVYESILKDENILRDSVISEYTKKLNVDYSVEK